MGENQNFYSRDLRKGDRGPGGGLIFYDAGSVHEWGRYLEVAPNRWNGGGWGDPKRKFFKVPTDFVRPEFDDPLRYTLWGYDAFKIGAGKRNTQELIQLFEKGAAVTASEYSGGGKRDWYLPSVDELAQLAAFALNRKSWRVNDSEKPLPLSTGFSIYPYWSSTIAGNESAFGHFFSYGEQSAFNISYSAYVRPIRAF